MTAQNMHGDIVPGYLGPIEFQGQGQTLTVGTSSSASAAISAKFVSISTNSTSSVFIAVGTAPVAVSNDDFFLTKDEALVIPIQEGDKIAAIASVANGSVFIHPVG